MRRRSDRAAQDAVRDQLVAAALAERPRRRHRKAAVLAVAAALLGATAAAQATGLIAVGEPIESLWPPDERALRAPFKPPNDVAVSVTARDPDYRYPWGVSLYTTAEGKKCVIAGQALGSRLGLERDGRFHPYGPNVAGSCGGPRLPVMSDMMRVPGPHPRTLVFGRVAKPAGPLVYSYRGERHNVPVARDGAFLLVLDGLIAPSALKRLE